MAATLTDIEAGQLQQTIEMFEVITQSQPNDCQSLEILRESYAKLDRTEDVLRTSKRIAQAYLQLGQLSAAILEYESILQRHPNDRDVQQALAKIANTSNSMAEATVEISSFRAPKALFGGAKGGDTKGAGEIDDGRQTMRKLFVDSKLVQEADFNRCWVTPDTADTGQVQDSFIQILADRNLVPVDKSLRVLSEKARVAYLPVDRYDIDIEWVRSFPRKVCQRWCVLPFDRMSKSVLAFTANPFNKQATKELEATLKGKVIWYLTHPAELVKFHRKIFR
jgi:tetratricopeptide (TPR) repeat protein